MADSLSRIKECESPEDIEEFSTEFVRILFNKEDVNWSLGQLKREQNRICKTENNNRNSFRKNEPNFQKVLIQKYVWHDVIPY